MVIPITDYRSPSSENFYDRIVSGRSSAIETVWTAVENRHIYRTEVCTTNLTYPDRFPKSQSSKKI
ncbi:MAG: hypothetical protein ACRC62_06255 [Microcoleus sp.]